MLNRSNSFNVLPRDVLSFSLIRFLFPIPELPTCFYCNGFLMRNAELLLNHCKTCTAMSRPSKNFYYMCYTCPYHTINNSNMMGHIRKHLGEKPFKCPHCDYSSTFLYNLRTHQKVRH
uniref:Zinc finger protein 711 n=1 Tax=Cacopsylla melanoneura TaxID=428564 RepID=A0A8D9E5G8_9HEMI